MALSQNGINYPNEFWRSYADAVEYAKRDRARWEQLMSSPPAPVCESAPPIWMVPDGMPPKSRRNEPLVDESWKFYQVVELVIVVLVAVLGVAVVLALADKPWLLKAMWSGVKWIIVHALH